MTRQSDSKQKKARRKLLRNLAAGGGVITTGLMLPKEWAAPVVKTVTLPAHAQVSPPAPATPPDPLARGFGPAAPPAGARNTVPSILDLVIPTAYAQQQVGCSGPAMVGGCNDDFGSDFIWFELRYTEREGVADACGRACTNLGNSPGTYVPISETLSLSGNMPQDFVVNVDGTNVQLGVSEQEITEAGVWLTAALIYFGDTVCTGRFLAEPSPGCGGFIPNVTTQRSSSSPYGEDREEIV